MELTKKEIMLIKYIRENVVDSRQCVIAVKYTPLGERGHTQSILSGTQLPLSSLRKSLANLLKDIKGLNTKGYTIFATHDATIGSLSVFEMFPKVKPNITPNLLTEINNEGI